MLFSIAILLVGLAMIYYGANFLTDGASSIAKKMRVSTLVIGLTVVAMGTSAPELAVSLTSALGGKSDIAIGNVVGSNIFNILVILGITAMILPLSVSKSTTKVEIPMVVFFSLLCTILCSDVLLRRGAENIIDRVEGLILLGFFVLFMLYTMYIARREGEEAQQDFGIKEYPWWLALIMIVGGLAMLVFGGRFFTNGASDIARSLGVSEAVIGLTLVAFGTSVPELATSIIAARKGQVDMAIGNVVGSNLFNLLLILGATATIQPIRISGISYLDYGVMILSSVLLFFFTLYFGQRKILRWEGGLLFAVYVGYTLLLLYQMPA